MVRGRWSRRSITAQRLQRLLQQCVVVEGEAAGQSLDIDEEGAGGIAAAADDGSVAFRQPGRKDVGPDPSLGGIARIASTAFDDDDGLKRAFIDGKSGLLKNLTTGGLRR